MALRVVQPETVKLDLSDGEWLIVKKRLTAGEARKVQARMIKTMAAGQKVELDPEQVGRSQAMEYLLDWSLAAVPIRDKSPDQIGRALDSIDPDSFSEVLKAIQQHEADQDAALEDAKKKTGPTELVVTSSSAA